LPEDGLGFHGPSLIAYGLNFLLLLGILYLVGYKPILRILGERQQKIQEGLESADRVRQEAMEQRAELQQQLEAARQDGQQLMTQARDAANRFREEEQTRAQENSDAFLNRARAEIEQERDSAIEEVRRHFSELAILAAEQIIHRTLDRDAHREVIGRVLEENDDLQQRKS
jgi:F-type H+-transporting ATPase subunit b